jgi:hypothetical protein
VGCGFKAKSHIMCTLVGKYSIRYVIVLIVSSVSAVCYSSNWQDMGVGDLQQNWEGVIHTGMQRVSTCILCSFALRMLLVDIKQYSISYIYYRSVTISIIPLNVTINHR